jgi:hypothetical protein
MIGSHHTILYDEAWRFMCGTGGNIRITSHSCDEVGIAWRPRELKFGELAVHVYKKTHWKFLSKNLLIF